MNNFGWININNKWKQCEILRYETKKRQVYIYECMINKFQILFQKDHHHQQKVILIISHVKFPKQIFKK